MDLLQILKPLHQDAVLWKSKRIWSKANNPDAIVDATNQISSMLLCIPEVIKRDRYVTHITKTINDGLLSVKEELKQAEKNQADTEKALAKLQKKKKRVEQDENDIEQLQEELNQLKLHITALRCKSLPDIDTAEVKRAIKDGLDKKDRALKQKQIQASVNANALTLDTLGLWEDFNMDDLSTAHEYGIAIYRGRYHTRGKNDDWIEISNFTMKIIYHVQTSTEAAYRLISIKNIYGKEKMVTINTDDFVSVGPFKKVLARQGDFVFRGSDTDLSRLHEFLQKDEKPTDYINILGYHPRGKFYAFANGLVDTADESGKVIFHQIDDYGIVSLRDHNYFIPAMSKMYIEKDEMFLDEKRFVYVHNEHMNFGLWSKLHRNVYKDRAVIGQLWVISAIFRDIIYGINHIRVSPLLNLAGQRGSGKTQFAESIMSLFGHPQHAIPLGSQSTAKGFLRKFGQLRDAVVYLEEYKNNIKKDFVEALKNIYDGTSYTRAQKTNDLQTDSVPVNSACLLGGQEMPTIEPALFSRVIMLLFEPGKYNEEDRKTFQKLKDVELHGLSCITTEVLRHRQAFQKNFASTFEAAKKKLFAEINNSNMDDRFIINISILYSIRVVLDGLIDFSFSVDEASEILISNLRKQFSVMEGNDDLGKWWMIIEQMTAQGMLRAGRDFRFDGGMLWLKMNIAYACYIKEMSLRRDPNLISKPSLEDYLRNDKLTYLKYEKVKLDTKSPQSYWAWCFNYTALKERYHIELSGYDSGAGVSYPENNTNSNVTMPDMQDDWSWKGSTEGNADPPPDF